MTANNVYLQKQVSRLNKEDVLMKTPKTHRIAFGILTSLLISLPPVVNAAFITDKIVVEVRAERFGQGAVLKELSSGASVEVLMSDGKYTRVRTPDNITGWVSSTFLTNKKPTQLEYLELLAKSKDIETKLRAAEKKLGNNGAAGAASMSDKDIKKLKSEAKNSRWMKAEMMKARDRAKQAEAKLKAERKKQSEKGKENNGAQQQLEDLKIQNHELEQRLAAALLVNEHQPEPAPTVFVASSEKGTTPADWKVYIPWFAGSLFTALILGFVAGTRWLDKRIRRRHGGFRIY
ncbi:MAG: hypothetical protein GXP17_08910 [Gammaproteobacteria bacterium]|nr:hypothetical protein [Gammaproteobacteria bacterium]